jgi:large subunit ribosomal protein L35
MPKQKTHKGAAARLKITSTGKILRRKGNINNYRRKKHNRSKSLFDEMIEVHPSVKKRLRKLLPYGS